ncbi:MAG: metallophosphoesterase [Candidatus Velamenicoccus archaeovorus]
MTTILAVSDEIDETLYDGGADRPRPDLVISCGDLPFDYLEYLVTRLSVPVLYVPGNHDPDLRARGEPVYPPGPRVEAFEDPPGPGGGTNVDGRIVGVKGVRVAGLGGSIRYRPGPNQYTQAEMRRRARRLRWRAAREGACARGGVDVLVTHAPPRGLGDGDDPAHVGIEALEPLVRRLEPRLLLHGHVHPYGMKQPDRLIGSTQVVNVVPSRLLELEP